MASEYSHHTLIGCDLTGPRQLADPRDARRARGLAPDPRVIDNSFRREYLLVADRDDVSLSLPNRGDRAIP